MGPSSTVVGAAMVNAVVVETVRLLLEAGVARPPVFASANLDQGDQRNQQLMEEYKDAIQYNW